MLTEADLVVGGGVWSLGPRPGNWASQALGDTKGCESFWVSRGKLWEGERGTAKGSDGGRSSQCGQRQESGGLGMSLS